MLSIVLSDRKHDSGGVSMVDSIFLSSGLHHVYHVPYHHRRYSYVIDFRSSPIINVYQVHIPQIVGFYKMI